MRKVLIYTGLHLMGKKNQAGSFLTQFLEEMVM